MTPAPKRRIALLASLAVLAAGAAATALAAGSLRSATHPDILPQLQGIEFATTCEFSHRRPDDPIVFPGQPELSHDHTFVGNMATDAFSTPRSLLAGATTCRRSDDTAAYWAPTLLHENRAVEPVEATIYYRRRTLAKVRVFPPGFQVVAGDAYATSPQGHEVTYWSCGEAGGVAPTSTVPTCPAGRATSLRLHVLFPDCWDGRRLDSPDHHAHMAYSTRARCPSTHPVAMPSIALVVRYPVTGEGSVELSSRGQFSGHADFVNAWQQPGLARLVNMCLNALRACGTAP
jgi:hypothetical protein